MKLLTALLLFPLAVLAQGNYPFIPEDEPFYKRISITASVKVANNISLSRSFGTSEMKAGPAYTTGIEIYILSNDDGRNAGAGLEYQFKNKILGIPGTYRNLPVYLFYNIPLVQIKYLSLPDIHIQLGYNILLADDFPEAGSSVDNGIYYAFGLANKLNKHIQVRLLYSVNQGKLDYRGGTHLFSNDKFSLNCGFVF